MSTPVSKAIKHTRFCADTERKVRRHAVPLAAGLTVLADVTVDIDGNPVDSLSGISSLQFGGYQSGWRLAFVQAFEGVDGQAQVLVTPTGTRYPLGVTDYIGSPTASDLNPDDWMFALGGCWHGPGFLALGSSSDNHTFTFNTGTADWDLGATFRFIRTNSGTFTLAAGSGVTLQSRLGSGSRTIPNQYGAALAQYIGNDTWVISGDIA